MSGQERDLSRESGIRTMSPHSARPYGMANSFAGFTISDPTKATMDSFRADDPDDMLTKPARGD